MIIPFYFHHHFVFTTVRRKVMLKKSFPIRDRFIAEHKAEYDDFMAIVNRVE